MTAAGRISQITDYLYLSGHHPVRPDKLTRAGIQVILNCTHEVPELSDKRFETFRINVMDVSHARLSPYFDRAADKIEEVRTSNKKILVHCVMGISRSASLCIAYLMKYSKMTLREAFKYVKDRRAIICPNPGFFKQLIEYEKKLHGKTTVQMKDYNKLVRAF